MLRASHHIDADVVRQPQVSPTGVGHDERSARLPGLAVAVDLDHLGTGMRSRAPDWLPVGPIADRVERGGIGEGELISWERVVLVLPGKTTRLRELHIERRAARARNNRQDAEEDPTMHHVAVEALVHGILQIPAALGNPVAKRVSESVALPLRVIVPAP